MLEITPEIRHWTAVHPKIGWTVSCYWLPGLKLVLDPLEVPEEVEGVEQIVLTNRHHRRSAFEAAERFGAPVHVPRVGLHEFEGDPVEPYDFETPFLDGAITAHQVTELWPDDGALHIPAVDALAIADTVLENGGELGWMPDYCFDDAAGALSASGVQHDLDCGFAAASRGGRPLAAARQRSEELLASR